MTFCSLAVAHGPPLNLPLGAVELAPCACSGGHGWPQPRAKRAQFRDRGPPLEGPHRAAGTSISRFPACGADLYHAFCKLAAQATLQCPGRRSWSSGAVMRASTLGVSIFGHVSTHLLLTVLVIAPARLEPTDSSIPTSSARIAHRAHSPRAMTYPLEPAPRFEIMHAGEEPHRPCRGEARCVAPACYRSGRAQSLEGVASSAVSSMCCLGTCRPGPRTGQFLHAVLGALGPGCFREVLHSGMHDLVPDVGGAHCRRCSAVSQSVAWGVVSGRFLTHLA